MTGQDGTKVLLEPRKQRLAVKKCQTTTYSNKSRRTFVLHFFSHTLGRKKCVRYVVTQCTIVSVTHDIGLRLAEFRAEKARPLTFNV